MSTLDIDVAVQFSVPNRRRKLRTDIESVMTASGALPFFTIDGLQKFTIPGYAIEFIVNGPVGRAAESGFVSLAEWNIHAQPLPFIRMLLDFSERVDENEYYVRIPIPEAFFIHKLIISNRRSKPDKARKDIDQCIAIMDILDDEKLIQVVASERFSSKTKKRIRQSCEEIGFRYDRLGIQERNTMAVNFPLR